MTNDDTARLAAHKLLDLASAFDPGTASMPEGAYETILSELFEIGAITTKMEVDNDDPDEDGPRIVVTVGTSELLGAVGFLLGLFVNYATLKSGGDRLAVINVIRGQIDAGLTD